MTLGDQQSNVILLLSAIRIRVALQGKERAEKRGYNQGISFVEGVRIH